MKKNKQNYKKIINKRRHLAHCERRAFERYDEMSIKNIIPVILEKIHRGDGEFVKRQSNSKTLWIITVGQKSYKVVYDKNTKCLVTFLPNENNELSTDPLLEEIAS